MVGRPGRQLFNRLSHTTTHLLRSKSLLIAAGVLLVLLFILALSARRAPVTQSPTASPTTPSRGIGNIFETHTPETSAPIPGALFGTVVQVVDGDTIKVRFQTGEEETVRLIGVDTPETVDPRKPVQCFGEEASAETKRLALNKFARLEYDYTQGQRDKYGRLLAYVFVDNDINPTGGSNMNLAERLIAKGFAHEYTYDKPYKYQSVFKDAEQHARSSQLGLWAPATCVGDTKQPAAVEINDFGPIPDGLPDYSGPYDPSGPDRDCADFATQSEAQAFFEAAGGPTSDRHRLDRDTDGLACEAN